MTEKERIIKRLHSIVLEIIRNKSNMEDLDKIGVELMEIEKKILLLKEKHK